MVTLTGPLTSDKVPCISLHLLSLTEYLVNAILDENYQSKTLPLNGVQVVRLSESTDSSNSKQ